jgi:hypothetical protein
MAESVYILEPPTQSSDDVPVTDDLKSLGKGAGTSKRAYSWYAGI